MKYTVDEVYAKLKDDFGYVLGKDIDINKITLDSRLEEDLGLSSVALIYFAVMIEEQFDISLEDEKLSNFKTINDVINCIIKKA